MRVSLIIVAAALGLILWTIFHAVCGLGWRMITMFLMAGFTWKGGRRPECGILGALYLAVGATLLAIVFSLPIALYLKAYVGNSKWVLCRLSLDVLLWGIPSICTARRFYAYDRCWAGASCWPASLPVRE